MICVDWGTSRLRAYRMAAGRVVARREGARGITTVAAGDYGAVLREMVGDWLESGERRVLMAGMVGSRQGWIEAPYVACPAGAGALAAGLVRVPFEGAEVAVVPGLCVAASVPEVMRGEETQLVGAVGAIGPDFWACLPGTHSKWARIEGGEVVGFTTHLTGEAFAALRGHTILGRMMVDGEVDRAAFLRGVARAGQAGGLLHHLFGVRTLGLFDRLAASEGASYLSGLLIGHEVAAAGAAGPVSLIGSAELCELYGWALEAAGVDWAVAPPDLSAAGLGILAERAGWA